MSTSFDNILTAFEKLSIDTEYQDHEGVKEYNILLANISSLKCCNYTKSLANRLHIKNKIYIETIFFDTSDSFQMEIKQQLIKCLEINPKTDHALYCLKTKKLLNNIHTYISQ
jgi:hypothetical protein